VLKLISILKLCRHGYASPVILQFGIKWGWVVSFTLRNATTLVPVSGVVRGRNKNVRSTGNWTHILLIASQYPSHYNDRDVSGVNENQTKWPHTLWNKTCVSWITKEERGRSDRRKSLGRRKRGLSSSPARGDRVKRVANINTLD
jgi:hypothetical protein